ncbi:MAG TPA: DUF2934 domain-containing protein [Gammaproteobacteria bacterium]|nr:DUF2934 domain-containing protein [Gammaproteobacteria bacterium]
MATQLRSAPRRRKPTKLPQSMADEPEPPTEERVRLLAYHLYERRQADGASGDAASDWLEAERLLANGEN